MKEVSEGSNAAVVFPLEVPQMLVKMMKDVKPVTVIEQNGDDFTIKIQTSLRNVTNSFTVGRESEMTSMDGRKFQVIFIIG